MFAHSVILKVMTLKFAEYLSEADCFRLCLLRIGSLLCKLSLIEELSKCHSV